MLHRQEIDIKEPVHAIGQAFLFATVQLGSPDGSSDAFLPADFGERMGLWCPKLARESY